MSSPPPSEPAASAPLAQPPTPLVNPTPDSRLDQLAAEYAWMKPRLDELTAQLKTITDGIKTELTRAHPGSTEVLLTSPHLTKPLLLNARESWRLDARAMKAQDPETYVAWAKKSTSWRLDPVG